MMLNQTNITLKKINSISEWKTYFNSIAHTSLFQSSIYLESKLPQDYLRFYAIFDNDQMIGVFATSIKKYFPFILHKLNNGPIFIDKLSYKKKYYALKSIKKHFKIYKGKILILQTGTNIKHLDKPLLKKSGFLRIKDFPFSYSSIVDLSLSEDVLRKQLKSKWRNQLNKSEKNELIFKEESQRYSELIKIYKTFCKEKGFQGISNSFLEKLNKIPEAKENLFSFTIYSEDKLAGFAIFITHSQTATYFLGWTDNAYKNLYIGNFYLWNAIITLKNKGIKFLDLGGINDKKTPSIGKFKKGLEGKKTQHTSIWI